MADSPADRLRKALEHRQAHVDAMRERAAGLAADRESAKQKRLAEITALNEQYERDQLEHDQTA